MCFTKTEKLNRLFHEFSLLCFKFDLIGYIFRYLTRGLTASYLFLNSITMTAFLRYLPVLFICVINVTSQIIIVYSKKRLIKLQLPKYTPIHQIRNNGYRGGGVAIYAHNSLGYKITKKQRINSNDMECACIEIISKNVENIIVSCIYGPPGVTHINL